MSEVLDDPVLPGQSRTARPIYFETEPYMGPELLAAYPDLRLVSLSNDATARLLKRQGWDVVTLGAGGISAVSSIVAPVAADSRFLRECLRGGPSVSFALGVTPVMEQLRRDGVTDVAQIAAALRQRLGNKLRFRDLCSELRIPCNDALEVDQVSVHALGRTFDAVKEQMGLPFVAQSRWGHGGTTTFLIQTLDDLRARFDELRAGCRFTRYIADAIPVASQGCVGVERDFCGGMTLQLTGFEALGRRMFQHFGNDTNTELLPPDARAKIRDWTLSIAAHLREQGFKGIFGVDFLYDPEADEVFAQELNPRLTSSSRLILARQLDQGAPLDMTEHLRAFGFDPLPGGNASSAEGGLTQSACAQIDIRNTSTFGRARRWAPGAYEWDGIGLRRVGDALSLKDIPEDQIIITQVPNEGATVPANGILCRAIMKRSVTRADRYDLTDWVQGLAEAIRADVLGPA